jgi:hypothetical protein
MTDGLRGYIANGFDVRPCLECGGSDIVHCCEGERPSSLVRSVVTVTMAALSVSANGMMALLDGPGAVDGSGRTVYSYAHPMFWAPYSVIGDGGGT